MKSLLKPFFLGKFSSICIIGKVRTHYHRQLSHIVRNLRDIQTITFQNMEVINRSKHNPCILFFQHQGIKGLNLNYIFL